MQFRFGVTPITINMTDHATLRAALRARLIARQGFALATLNLDHVVLLRRQESFRAVYARQDLICADGNPIVWLSRLARKPVQLLPGADLLLPCLELATACGRSVAFVGSSEEVLDSAARKLKQAVPGLDLALCHAPPMGFDPTGEAARLLMAELAARDVGLCIVALGAPKQERFAALGRELAPTVGFASFGAGLDFVAGRQTRAPAWVRALALEWLWRAATSPRRLVPRYLACLAVLPGEIGAALRLRRKA